MADFSKASGNSTKGVELIAVVRPDRVAYKKDESGKPTSEPVAHYVDIMVNNSALKKADIQAGKGQERPNLLNQKAAYTDKDGVSKTGYNHEIRFTNSQIASIKAAGESKALTKEDGTMYIPFKADVMPLTETVKDKDGNAIMNDNGKPKMRVAGYMPNTKTIEPTELGNLTQNRLDKHFANTKAIGEVCDEKRAAEKAAKGAKLSAEAAKAAPEAEAEQSNELGA